MVGAGRRWCARKGEVVLWSSVGRFGAVLGLLRGTEGTVLGWGVQFDGRWLV